MTTTAAMRSSKVRWTREQIARSRKVCFIRAECSQWPRHTLSLRDEYAQTLTPMKKTFSMFYHNDKYCCDNEVKLNASTHLSTAFATASGTGEVTARALRAKRS
jgi:hypothetical protein